MLFVGLVSATVTAAQLKKTKNKNLQGFINLIRSPVNCHAVCQPSSIQPSIHWILPYLCHARGYNILCHVFLTCHVPEIKTTRQKRSPNRQIRLNQSWIMISTYFCEASHQKNKSPISVYISLHSIDYSTVHHLVSVA